MPMFDFACSTESNRVQQQHQKKLCEKNVFNFRL